MSTFACPVVEIQGHGKHKNADTLRITQVEGSTCIFKEGAFDKGDWAVFCPVDAVVPLDRSYFAWLRDPKKPNKTHHRVKAMRLRGVFSDGFLTPLREIFPEFEKTREAGIYLGRTAEGVEHEVKLGSDLSEVLGVTKAEDILPPALHGDSERDPGFMPVYDLEPWKKYRGVFENGEQVVITEKLHGTNSRFCYKDGRLWVGSHKRIVATDALSDGTIPRPNMWWAIARQYGLEEKLKELPELVVFGEVYGDVQDLKYGVPPGERRFAVFDIYETALHEYAPWPLLKAFCDRLGLPTVPVLYEGPYSADLVEGLTNPPEGQPAYTSTIAGCIREGVVVKTQKERWNPETRRTILKHVSQAYLLRKGGTEAH
jgi:RNA ligase (TIGR02306 family)